MGWTRRQWLHMVGLLPIGITLRPHRPEEQRVAMPLLRPRALRPGATVAILAPASPAGPHEVQEAVRLLRSFGCRVRLGATVQAATRRYLAAPDEVRAQELMEHVADPTVDAILCARGGYGVMRLLPFLDWELFRHHPKPIIGFSDITALLVAITSRARLVTYHGPVAVSTFDAFTVRSLRRTLWVPDALEGPWRLHDPSWEVLSPGVACGPLMGGNLSLLVATLGTPYEVDTRGAVLFLEDIGEEPYRVDRMLTQLLLAGKLQQCVAVLLGHFRAPWRQGRIPGSSIPGQPPLIDVVRERLGGLGIPILAGLPLGHVRSKLTLPLGVWAEVNASARTIRLVESSVADEVT